MFKKGGFLWKLIHGEPDFKPFKFQEIIYYVVSNIGRDLGSVEFGNILYLIDNEWASITSETLTEQKYYMGNWGPYNPYFRRVVDRMDGYEVKITKIGSEKTGKYRLIHKKGDNPRFKISLDNEEIAVLQKVYKDVDGLSQAKIKELIYQTEPVKAYQNGENYKFQYGDLIEFANFY